MGGDRENQSNKQGSNLMNNALAAHGMATYTFDLRTLRMAPR